MSDVTNRPCALRLRRGALLFEASVYDAHFNGLSNLVLLRDGAALLILPVRHAGAGGYVAKWRNSKGDRIVAAPDFFRGAGLDDDVERDLTAKWQDERAALIIDDLFS